MRRSFWFAAVLCLLGLTLWAGQREGTPPAAALSAPVSAEASVNARLPAFLPVQAQAVLQRIAAGGPFDYRQDGSVFQNREARLPAQPRGYYREYTVPTPGAHDRGARRIITGGEPPREYWYTDDHYRSFRRFQVGP